MLKAEVRGPKESRLQADVVRARARAEAVIARARGRVRDMVLLDSGACSMGMRAGREEAFRRVL